MKVVKKVGIALMIVVGILLALFLIFVGYLFVMPAHSLFGYRLANYSKNREITTTASVAGLTTENIVLRAGAYQLNLIVTDQENSRVSAIMSRDLFGLVKASQGDVKYNFEFDHSTNSLVGTTYEPDGLKLRGKCYVTVYIPAALIADVGTVRLETSSGAITVGADYALEHDNLYLVTESGEIVLDNVDLTGELTAELHAGSLTTTERTKLNLTKTKITTSKGKINFTEKGSNKYTFGDFVVDNSSTGYLSATEVDSLVYTGNGGKINITTINDVDINAVNTSVTLGKVDAGAYVNITNEGSISIGEANAYCDLYCANGKITIDKSNSKLSVSTSSGAVTIKSATEYVDVTTISGNINVTFAEETGYYDTTNSLRQALITTRSGAVNLVGVDYANVESKSGSSRVYVSFHNIADAESRITTKGAPVSILAPKGNSPAEDPNGDKYAITIVSTTTPEIYAGVGRVEHNADNVYQCYAYGADLNTVAKLIINTESGYVFITNGITA